jgi:hypothetical protein
MTQDTHPTYLLCVRFMHFSQGANVFFSFGATAPIWALAYLHETLRFTSVY